MLDIIVILASAIGAAFVWHRWIEPWLDNRPSKGGLVIPKSYYKKPAISKKKATNMCKV